PVVDAQGAGRRGSGRAGQHLRCLRGRPAAGHGRSAERVRRRRDLSRGGRPGALPLGAPAPPAGAVRETLRWTRTPRRGLGQSWNILGGFAGQINLGHAAFFGTGALVARSLWLNGLPFGAAFLVGGLTAAACALVIGVPTFRLRGIYFSIGTLAMAEAVRITVGNALPGLTALPTELLVGYDLASRYYLALGLALATVL